MLNLSIANIAALFAVLGVHLAGGQVSLPGMVTIPPDAPLATGVSNFSTYIMTIYDEACVKQSEMSDGNSTGWQSSPSSSSSADDDSTLSQWIQSQYVVYIGAVALNNNNTCQVVCQVQTLKQFAIMFGSDIRTRSVLVGRVYMTSMQDDTDCTVSGNGEGVCMAGECVPGSGGGDTNSTTTMMPETSTVTEDWNSTTTTMMPDNSSSTMMESNDNTTTSAPIAASG